jgi:hypothetical protein
MTDLLREKRIKFKHFTCALGLAAGAALSGACGAPPGGEAEAEPLPAPGSIEISQPLKLAERARVPEKETGFVSAQLGEHELAITHDGRLPVFAAGDVLGGTQGGGYLVRVTGARELDSTHVALATVPAHLTELLAEGKFHVHYDAQAYSQHLDDFIARQSASEEGEEDGERIASRAQALKIDAGAPVALLDLAGAALPASCGIKASGHASLDVTARLYPAIDLEVEIGPKGGLNPLPELKQFRLVASGQLDVSAKLHGTGKVKGSCQVDLLGLAGGVPSVMLPALTFWVGPVPVVVTTEVVPVANAEVELAFNAAEVTAEAEVSAALEAGVDYQDKTWSTIWDPSCEGTGTAAIEAPGAVTASCTVSAGAELRARLYGILGPNLGVEAYARAQAETAPPYCTYDVQIDGGVRAYAEAALGVSVGPFELTLAELELVDYELVHFNGPQFSGQLRDAPECSDDSYDRW